MPIGFVFVGKPGLIFAGAGIFLLGFLIALLLGRKFKSVLGWPLLAVAIAWMLAAVWEIYCMEREYNIRPDAFLIYPILIMVSLSGFLVSAGSIIFSLIKKGRRV